jgi:hypothetical protein
MVKLFEKSPHSIFRLEPLALGGLDPDCSRPAELAARLAEFSPNRESH